MNPNSGPNSKLSIDYDEKSARFVINAPFWMLDKVRSIPSRRWDARRRVWTAPALRINSKYVLTTFPASVFTQSAKEAANASLERRANHITPFPRAYKFKTKPRAYQLAGLDRAWGKNVFAFYMDMGTGKTKTALDLFAGYYLDEKIDRVLVVTKFTTRRNWEQEIKIHCPFECDVMVLDTSKPKVFADWNTSGGALKFLIVGTESLGAGSAVTFAQKYVDCSTRVGMVVDEAHMIKNHSAVRSEKCVKLGKSANYKIILTGTPIANSPMDVFMQFEFLDPNIIGIGDFYSFRNRYAVMGEYENKKMVGYQNMSELIELVAPFVYQVRKSEVLTELPPKVYEVREVKLNDEQKRLYKDIAKRDKALFGDRKLTVSTVLERMLRLQQIAGGVIAYQREPDQHDPSKYEHARIPGVNAKIEELLSIAEEDDVPTIVWCRFLEEIGMVSEALRKVYGHDSVVEIHGGISEDERWHNVSDLFQSGKARFIVGNAATGGVGLNMTRAELVVYYSNSFSYTDRVQSEDRAHRIGQTKSVTYIDLIAEGTVDGVIMQALQDKNDVSEFVRVSINDRNENTLMGALA